MKIYSFYGRKNICGDRIREARNKQRISQADLAARLQIEGVTLERDSISRIEIGTRFVSDYELMTFAKTLDVPVTWLLSDGEFIRKPAEV
jgi:Predicted transcription factor, homolog of eukaryotic MBF1